MLIAKAVRVGRVFFELVGGQEREGEREREREGEKEREREGEKERERVKKINPLLNLPIISIDSFVLFSETIASKKFRVSSNC